MMTIIDLSQPLFDSMPVYPGDPEVHIQEIHHLDKEGWRLRYLQMSSHIGTHTDKELLQKTVNVYGDVEL